MIQERAFFFYLLSAIILTGGFLAVTSRKIFRAAIWLLFSLVGIAGLFFWMQMEFIAAVQIVVYVGGIVVLIIFSIFLTQKTGQNLPKPSVGRALFAILAAVFGLALTFTLIRGYDFKPSQNTSSSLSVSELGSQLLSTSSYGYALPLELVSVLLLSAMVGCIVIAMKIKSK
jgi:NADH-quinone oxidoreductase subunit J